MAHHSDYSSSPYPGVARVRCSYKTATAFVCTCNVLATFYMLNSFITPLYLFSTPPKSPSLGIVLQSPHSSLRVVRYSEDQLSRIKAAVEIWKAAEPVDLIKRVKEIEEEAASGVLTLRRTESGTTKVASDLAQRLKELQSARNQNDQQVLEEWRQKKLEEARKREITKGKQEDLWAMEESHEAEDGVSPDGPLPPECRAEPHTDYGGAAVRWGLTHHVESATDCCAACLDQARDAKQGEMKCNIWVYCPSEAGCHSPDKYEHKHHECWLKQDDKPKVSFKGKYDPRYRKEHPTAPVVVPWVSGVVGV